jgi:hypothetical protein
MVNVGPAVQTGPQVWMLALHFPSPCWQHAVERRNSVLVPVLLSGTVQPHERPPPTSHSSSVGYLPMGFAFSVSSAFWSHHHVLLRRWSLPAALVSASSRRWFVGPASGRLAPQNRTLNNYFPFRALQSAILSSSVLPTMLAQALLSPTCADVQPARETISLSTLETFCMMLCVSGYFWRYPCTHHAGICILSASIFQIEKLAHQPSLQNIWEHNTKICDLCVDRYTMPQLFT